MKLVRGAVIQEDGKRFVECEIANGPTGSAAEYIRLRVEIDAAGHPRVPECLLAGLQRARAAITSQTTPLEDPVTRGF
jgi:hypothetical protein